MGHTALEVFPDCCWLFSGWRAAAREQGESWRCCLSEQEKGPPVSGYLEILAWLESKCNGKFLWPICSSLKT